MAKKLIFLFFIFILIGGGFFYWWQNQKDVRELNKTLPEGLKIVKNLIGNEYGVVNKIDGYEFKVPKEWEGFKTIEYTPKRSELGYTAASINMESKEGSKGLITIDQFENLEKIDLKFWAEDNFRVLGLTGRFVEDKLGEFNIVKTQESVHLGGMFVYFFQKDLVIYAVTGDSEDFIHYIIINGKW
jgi:hypothetical protein